MVAAGPMLEAAYSAGMDALEALLDSGSVGGDATAAPEPALPRAAGRYLEPIAG